MNATCVVLMYLILNILLIFKLIVRVLYTYIFKLCYILYVQGSRVEGLSFWPTSEVFGILLCKQIRPSCLGTCKKYSEFHLFSVNCCLILIRVSAVGGCVGGDDNTIHT